MFCNTTRGPACLSNIRTCARYFCGACQHDEGAFIFSCRHGGSLHSPPGLTVIKKQHSRSNRNVSVWLFPRIQSVCVNYSEPVLVLQPSVASSVQKCALEAGAAADAVTTIWGVPGDEEKKGSKESNRKCCGKQSIFYKNAIISLVLFLKTCTLRTLRTN